MSYALGVGLPQRRARGDSDGGEAAAADPGGDLGPVAIAERLPVHIEILKAGD